MAQLDTKISINLLTTVDLNSVDNGRVFVDLVTAEFSFLCPDKFGNGEPLRTRYSPVDKEAILEAWQFRAFHWKKSRPFVDGGVMFAYGPHRQHSWLHITLGSTVDISEVVRFAQTASTAFSADFATIHMMGSEEVDEILGDLKYGSKDPKVFFNNPRNGLHLNIVTSHDIKRFIPNLYWATVFGPPYVEIFGKRLLLQAPAFKTAELADGSIYMQLSPSPSDFVSNYALQNNARRIVREYLGHNAFLDYSLPLDHQYTVPAFRF